MKILFFLFPILTLTTTCIGQTTLTENETLLFYFKTTTGKSMLLSKDKKDNSIYYRFGTDKKTELEYRSNKTDNGLKIMYSFYLRGGGLANEGMDLNYVYFRNANFQYIIFDNYYARENKSTTGLKVINLKTKETTLINADTTTVKGNLVQFRDNQLLNIGEDIFD